MFSHCKQVLYLCIGVGVLPSLLSLPFRMGPGALHCFTGFFAFRFQHSHARDTLHSLDEEADDACLFTSCCCCFSSSRCSMALHRLIQVVRILVLVFIRTSSHAVVVVCCYYCLLVAESNLSGFVRACPRSTSQCRFNFLRAPFPFLFLSFSPLPFLGAIL